MWLCACSRRGSSPGCGSLWQFTVALTSWRAPGLRSALRRCLPRALVPALSNPESVALATVLCHVQRLVKQIFFFLIGGVSVTLVKILSTNGA